ncbi:SMP-30/gluconolactonase/LRE family protein [Actinoplanes sp. TRM 88003]|uniref:SMP-30/gluconolactonase/LRE family protein n=1 Tax=Paractinoplanes aksuensis TaxID=2939490 RepID=A0ABT1DLI5_9ACTN|nr:SMP-30/gluconolactonase/LRE family protein [Actinoplanes aksuensis]MCO8271685.1 SMP-30/gluconolactonase/LRE family protein [Actinoplanes aksuensis]
MTDEVTTVVDGFTFTEAPRWHEGRLWFSDFYSSRVMSARADGTDLRLEATVEQQPSGLGWLPDGRLLIVSMRDRRILRREPDGTLVTHADLSGHATGHLNDMAVDAEGRAYVGNFGFDLMAGDPIEPAALHRADPDGTVTELATGLWFPNAIALTPGGTVLVNETFGNRITAFDLAADGTLVNRRVWAEFGPLPTDLSVSGAIAQLAVAPDGSCLDAEGGLWVADAVGGRLIRVVEGGEITDEVRPGTNVYACALSGNTLYACAAPDFYEHARRAAREGSIIAVPV